MEKRWKDLLLKSGLPFEYEVKQHFEKKGCLVYDEYIYSRVDENNIEKDFSYDLDATYFRGAAIDLMIECKYKVKETNWFFLPDSNSYLDDIYQDDFFFIGDYFVNPIHQFSRKRINDKNFIGPLCGKGIEIFEGNCIEINIRKAIHQISYAFIEKVITGIDEQLHTETFFDTAFITIPVIITNAKLNVIKKNITVREIQNAKTIEEVSDETNFLVHRSKIGTDLRNYNKKKLTKFFSSNLEHSKKHIRTGTIDQLIDDLSEMPQLILFMNHSETSNSYDTLFQYIDTILEERHPDAIKRRMPKPKYITEVEERLAEIIERKKKNII